MDTDGTHVEPQTAPDAGSCLIVGLGASAGGIEALEAFFSGLPEVVRMAFVIVLHLDPDEESRLAEVLQRNLLLPVTQVTEAVEVEAGHVYVIPPNKNILAADGTLVLEPIEEERARRRPIDYFFRTLADAYGDRAVGVILSGTGADGAVGVTRVREVGGYVLAQAPEDAGFGEMPRSVIATGVVDGVGSAQELGAEVAAYAERLRRGRLPAAPDALPEDGVRALQHVLALLRVQTGHDFAHYKRSTVLRRLDRRLHVTGTDSLEAYLAHLRTGPAEARALLADLLISVTSFFRDPEAFAVVEREVVPRLFEGRGPTDEVRVWVPACATGEEAYSLAILLLEHAATLAEPPAVQVFATDLSEEAVRVAREGRYPESIEADVSRERLRRFFTREGGHYRVSELLRDVILFAPHSLLRDPPFSRLALISCRNLLIYLQRDLQEQVLALVHHALQPGGFLFLGTSETTAGSSDLYTVVDKGARLYRRLEVQTSAPRLPRAPRIPAVSEPPSAPAPRTDAPPDPQPAFAELHRTLRAEAASPSVLVSEAGDVVHISDTASPFLQVGSGMPTRSLVGLLHPELRMGVQAALFEARRAERSAQAGPVRLLIEGAAQRVTARVRPVAEGEFFHVVFDAHPEPTSETVREPKPTRARVEVLEAELDRAYEQLQLTIEEFETNREELRAQNEELQSINEELRSLAEELETSREEAQSMAEELQTVNDELKAKVEELGRAKDDLENLITATEIATFFLDRDLRIQRFTPRARDHFHVRSSDLGRPLAELAPTFGDAGLIEDAEAVLETLEVHEREVQSEHGRWFLVHVRPYRTLDDRIPGVVVTFVDITERRQAEASLRRSEERYRLLVEGATEYAMLMLDLEGRITSWSAGAERIFGYDEDEVLGQPGLLIFTEEDRAADVPEREMAVAAHEGHALDDRWHVRKDGSRFWANGFMTPLRHPDGSLRGFAKILRDDTQRKRAEDALRTSEERLRVALSAAQMGVWSIDVRSGAAVRSERFYEIYGYTPDPDGATLDDFYERIHPDDRDQVRAAVEAAARGERPYREEFRIVRPDSEVRWVHTEGQLVQDDADGHVRLAGVVYDVTARREAEQALQALTETLEQRVRERTRALVASEEHVRELARRLVEAEQKERHRIAQVLHDDLQQQLFGLGMTLDLLRSSLSEEAHTLCDQATGILDEATELTRSLSVELSPPVLTASRLEEILQWVAFRKEEQYGLRVEVEVEGACKVSLHTSRVLLYQILREVLFNVVKHAGTLRVRLRAREEGGLVVVEAEDDGTGFEVETVASRPGPDGGFGLASARERVELIGGRFEIDSAPGRGTRVTIGVPVAAPGAEEG